MGAARIITMSGRVHLKSSLRRCPTIPTPRSFKSSPVNVGRMASSIPFSRNAASYRSRPRPRSQPPMSMMAPRSSQRDDHPGEARCPGYPHFRPCHTSARRTATVPAPIAGGSSGSAAPGSGTCERPAERKFDGIRSITSFAPAHRHGLFCTMLPQLRYAY
jgi:hypothetical protein